MLNFAEQTGSGAVILVWSFLTVIDFFSIYLLLFILPLLLH